MPSQYKNRNTICYRYARLLCGWCAFCSISDTWDSLHLHICIERDSIQIDTINWFAVSVPCYFCVLNASIWWDKVWSNISNSTNRCVTQMAVCNNEQKVSFDVNQFAWNSSHRLIIIQIMKSHAHFINSIDCINRCCLTWSIFILSRNHVQKRLLATKVDRQSAIRRIALIFFPRITWN